MAEQTEQVLKNLERGAGGGGCGLDERGKDDRFSRGYERFCGDERGLFGRFFSDNKPARATVQAARLPRDAKVEIECIAVV